MLQSGVPDDGHVMWFDGHQMPDIGHFLWFDGQQCPMTGTKCPLAGSLCGLTGIQCPIAGRTVWFDGQSMPDDGHARARRDGSATKPRILTHNITDLDAVAVQSHKHERENRRIASPWRTGSRTSHTKRTPITRYGGADVVTSAPNRHLIGT